MSGVGNLKSYYWRVGSKTQKVWSNVRKFTARHISPTTTKLAVAGDIGSFTHSKEVVAALARRTDLAAYVTCGDLSYSTLSPKMTPIQARNDNWGILHQKVLSKFPQVPVFGNHDMYDNHGAVYDHRYNVHVSPSKLKQHYFSMVIGGIHLAVIDNMFDQSASSPMVAWLKDDLAAAKAKRDAGKIQHIVVTGHYPLYSNGLWTSVIKVLEPIMVAYGVDVYVCGHVHEYQRTYPLNNQGVIVQSSKTTYKNPKGVVHVTVGTGGIPLDGKPDNTPLRKYQVMKSKAHYGYLLLTSKKSGDLLVQFVDIKDVVRDSFVVSHFTATVKMAAPGVKRQSEDGSTAAPLADEPEVNNEEETTETTEEETIETTEETTETTEEETVASDETATETEENNDTEEQTLDDEEQETFDESEVVEESGPEDESLDFGDKFGDAHDNLGWVAKNEDHVESTECFSFNFNTWELAVPHVGVYEAKVELYGTFEDPESIVLSVEGDLVKASQLTQDGERYVATVAVAVNDGRLTLSSPSSEGALCGVSVHVAQGTVVNVDIDPLAPSAYGFDDTTDDSDAFVVNKETVTKGFAKMTGHDESRFVVISVEPKKDSSLLTANILIRDLPTDADLTVSDSLAEFAALSGDSFWQRSGLQIQRMEVGHSKALPKAAQISLLTVGCVVIVAAVVVIAVVLYRRHKKQQAARQSAEPSLMSAQA